MKYLEQIESGIWNGNVLSPQCVQIQMLTRVAVTAVMRCLENCNFMIMPVLSHTSHLPGRIWTYRCVVINVLLALIKKQITDTRVS